jgi:hypothetical protein
MRLALLGLGLSLCTLPLSAQVNRVAQSSVTLAATFSKTGTTTTGTPNNNRVSSATQVSAVRFGNLDLLQGLVEQGHITETRGWAVVAVWANWSGPESSYRFFARRKTSAGVENVAIDQLSLEFLDPHVLKNLRLRSGDVVSGTEFFKAYSRLTLSDPRDPDLAISRVPTSTVLGMVGGSGSYVRPARSTSVIFTPAATSFTGFGTSVDDGSDPVLAIIGLRLGRSSAVDSALFPAVAGPGRGPEAAVP